MVAAARIVGLLLCLGWFGDRADAATPAGAPVPVDFAAVVAAGGGPDHFRTLTLVGELAGPDPNAEVAALTKRFGAQVVKAAISTVDFAVADALRRRPRARLELAKGPTLATESAPALRASLIAAGSDPRTGRFTLDRLCARLVTRAVYAQIERDIRVTLGPDAELAFHAVVAQALADIGSARTHAFAGK